MDVLRAGNFRTTCSRQKLPSFQDRSSVRTRTRTQTRNSIPRRVFEHIIVCFSSHVCTYAIVHTPVCMHACVRVLTLYGLRCLTCKLRTSDQEASASLSRLIVVINSCNIINSVTRMYVHAVVAHAPRASISSFRGSFSEIRQSQNGVVNDETGEGRLNGVGRASRAIIHGGHKSSERGAASEGENTTQDEGSVIYVIIRKPARRDRNFLPARELAR